MSQRTNSPRRPVLEEYQTPLADHIRNEEGIPVMAVGNIYEPDHLDSILAAEEMTSAALLDPIWYYILDFTCCYTRQGL